MDVEAIEEILERYPIHITGDPLSVCLLENVEPEHSYESFKKRLDSIFLMPNERYVILEDNSNSPFPKLNLDTIAIPDAINAVIHDRFKAFSLILLHQSDISRRIIDQAHKYDIIIFVIVDGLSYFDCEGRSNIMPCLVDGLPTTEHGYLNCVGDPQIGRQLFACGFKNLIGFSYWTKRTDPTGLTHRLFIPFSNKRVIRIRSFGEVLDVLNNESLLKTYVQIVMHGLDQMCHSHQDDPLISQTVNRIFNRIDELKDTIKRKKLNGLVCMTSDHGILWREDSNLRTINEPSQTRGHSPRYLDGRIMRDYTVPITSLGRNYSLLRYPFITRKLRNNEWGVHGGLSAQECITPLLMEEVEQ